MSTLENTRMIIKVCELYYLNNKTQKEISSLLGISRPQISRLIEAGRQRNIVSISIHNPYLRETELESYLTETFGVEDALVFSGGGVSNSEKLKSFAAEASAVFQDSIPAGSTVGLMSGNTIAEIVDHMHPSALHIKSIVSLSGGLSNAYNEIHANTIAAKMARYYGVSSMSLNAPAVVSDENLMQSLRQENSIRQVIDNARKCNLALVGIGTMNPEATNIKVGCLTDHDIEYLQKEKAVASICGTYLDADGNDVGREVTRRTVGISLAELSHCRVIAAAIGKNKVEAIIAILKSGRIQKFVTDVETAELIMKKMEETK